MRVENTGYRSRPAVTRCVQTARTAVTPLPPAPVEPTVGSTPVSVPRATMGGAAVVTVIVRKLLLPLSLF